MSLSLPLLRGPPLSGLSIFIVSHVSCSECLEGGETYFHVTPQWVQQLTTDGQPPHSFHVRALLHSKYALGCRSTTTIGLSYSWLGYWYIAAARRCTVDVIRAALCSAGYWVALICDISNRWHEWLLTSVIVDISDRWHQWSLISVIVDNNDCWHQWSLTSVIVDISDCWQQWLLTSVIVDISDCWHQWLLTLLIVDISDRWH